VDDVLNTEALDGGVLNTPRARREYVGFRLAPAALAEIDRLAERDSLTRSDLIRQLLRLGLAAYASGRR
jgi:metal-responsive CopG/Arc/MetJ family transcriptional regulator